MEKFIDFIIHIDAHMLAIINTYGLWSYLIIFGVIFAETGFVVTPFLPGDSLLFVIGALAAKDGFNLFTAFLVLSVAAVLGDSVNYFIGHKIGRRAFKGKHIFNVENLEKTESFYEKHGGKTILLARFVPIVRTFAPFVAGVGRMDYSKFALYNIIGGLLWVSLFLFGGYFFGNLSFVKENFTYVIFAIIAMSLLPGLFEFVRNKINDQKK